jgi:hypothetical protein
LGLGPVNVRVVRVRVNVRVVRVRVRARVRAWVGLKVAAQSFSASATINTILAFRVRG